MLSKRKLSFWRTIKPFINSRNNENTGSIKLKDNAYDETISTFFTSASDINEDSNNTGCVLIYHTLLKI